jgi:hypothetical protein
MDMRDLRDEKETRIQVRRDIDALERVSFEYRGIGKQRGAWLKVSIAGGTVGQVKNGDIIFRFNQDFFDSYRIGSENKYLLYVIYIYYKQERGSPPQTIFQIVSITAFYLGVFP